MPTLTGLAPTLTHAAPAGFGRRTLLAAAGLLAVARPARAAAPPDTLRIVAPWEYTSDDPADTGYIHTRLGIAQTLVGVEPDGTLVGQIAERWTVDPDRLTWRFALRAGTRFHDGTPVTAEAVVQCLRRAMVGESLSAVPLAGIEVEGGDVVMRTTTPFHPLPAFLVDYAGIVLAPSAYAADGTVARIVATGPYRLVGTTGRTGIAAERFEGAWGRVARVPRLAYTAVVNGDTRANLAIAGDADLTYTLLPQALPRIAASGQATVRSLTIPRLRLLTFDVGLPQFADPRVRRALSMAIDRAGIAAGILRHPPSAATQLLPPVLSEWHNPALPPLRTDPAAARALLDQAGWIPGSDGIRVKDGVRLAATVMVPSNRPELPIMATAIQAQFRDVGMAMAIDVSQSSALPQAIRDGRMQMALIARTYVNVPDPIATIIPDYTRERSVWGTVRWPERERMRALTDAYVTGFDPAARPDLRARITALIHEEMPVVPVSWFEHTVAVSDRTRDVVVDPYEARYYAERAAFG